MERVLVFIEGWGRGDELRCEVDVKDYLGEPVALRFFKSLNKGNRIIPTDDDRASAISILVEYLYNNYDKGIAIVRDVRLRGLFGRYIRKLHNHEDFCAYIYDNVVRSRCYKVLNMPDEDRRHKLRHFHVIMTEKFMASRDEVLELLRQVLYFMVGVELTDDMLSFLTQQTCV
jgi:hypothetical protein